MRVPRDKFPVPRRGRMQIFRIGDFLSAVRTIRKPTQKPHGGTRHPNERRTCSQERGANARIYRRELIRDFLISWLNKDFSYSLWRYARSNDIENTQWKFNSRPESSSGIHARWKIDAGRTTGWSTAAFRRWRSLIYDEHIKSREILASGSLAFSRGSKIAERRLIGSTFLKLKRRDPLIAIVSSVIQSLVLSSWLHRDTSRHV